MIRIIEINGIKYAACKVVTNPCDLCDLNSECAKNIRANADKRLCGHKLNASEYLQEIWGEL